MFEEISWGSDFVEESSFEEILGRVLVRMAFGLEKHTLVTTCPKGNIKDWFSLLLTTTCP